MDNTNTGAEQAASAAEVDNSTTPSENTQTQDNYKNLKGEFNRKLDKMNREMSQKLDAVLNAFSTRNAASAAVSQTADEAPEVDTDVKQYVDNIVTQQKQKDAWSEALTMFPELDPESESFDEKFYKAVDAEFSTNQRRDPRGPLKAAKLAALELGKIEQLARQNLLKDEARRSRILSEGASTPREAKKEKDPAAQFNRAGLARLGINPEKLAQRIKNNKEKYEGL